MSSRISVDNASVPAIAVTSSGEGEAYWFFGNLAVVRSPEAARPVVIEMHLPEGSAAPLHYHETLQDNWYVVSGVIAIKDGEDTALVRAGDHVATRPGIPQSHFVLEGPATVLQLHADVDFLEFVRQFGTPAADPSTPPASAVDFARAAEVAKATGQPIVGPPMSEAEAREIARTHGHPSR